MKRRIIMFALAVLMVALSTYKCTPSAAAQPNDLSPCPVTKPNGNTPPGERPSAHFHGGSGLWTVLWPDGRVVFEPGGPGFVQKDGSLSMKFPWWRGVKGKLTIAGRRLDGAAPPLRASIPHGYDETGFQATSLIFPAAGCWEVTGKVGEAHLTFVVFVVKVEGDK
jgi:hypothetical protein